MSLLQVYFLSSQRCMYRFLAAPERYQLQVGLMTRLNDLAIV